MPHGPTAPSIPGWWSAQWQHGHWLVGSLAMGTHLTKRRAVDLCRVATCLCRPVI
ncbi:Ms5788A family Cys-rich leader peptide [Micromonospora sp. CA-259024]|uniref:Ms5788A family Cys-rich leader peptide n=1 Tax=Micromonospora sp. CA-259024 TaxID=3239965 RepID=UPI003D91A68D